MVRHQRLWLQGPAKTSCSVLVTILQFCPLKSFKILVSRKTSMDFFCMWAARKLVSPSETLPPAAPNRWLTTQKKRYALVCPQSHQAGNFWVLKTDYTIVGGSCPTLVSSRGCHSLAVYPGCVSFHFLPRLPALKFYFISPSFHLLLSFSLSVIFPLLNKELKFSALHRSELHLVKSDFPAVPLID